jgi:hypothetical protein
LLTSRELMMHPFETLLSFNEVEVGKEVASIASCYGYVGVANEHMRFERRRVDDGVSKEPHWVFHGKRHQMKEPELLGWCKHTRTLVF